MPCEAPVTITVFWFPAMTLVQRFDRRTQLGREDFRLFPRRKVAAFVEFVIMDKLRVSLLSPAPWSLVELVWERAHRDRNDDVFRSKEGELAFPIQARRRDSRIR